MEQWDEGRMQVAAGLAEAFRELGLTGVEAVMGWTGGTLLRQLRDRANVRFQMAGSNGTRRTFFMKRHRARHLAGWLWSLVTGRPVVSAGAREAANIQRLRAAGFSTPTVAAWGQRQVRPWLVESFIITEALAGAQPLDDFLRDRSAAHGSGAGLAEKRDLIRRVAELVRRFHEAGFNHRDLYACHVFVGLEAGHPLWLLDLQRVQHRRCWRRGRWRLKDIAQLAYSSRFTPVTATDRLRFLKTYRHKARLGADDKAFVRRVLRKAARIAWHDRPRP